MIYKAYRFDDMQFFMELMISTTFVVITPLTPFPLYAILNLSPTTEDKMKKIAIFLILVILAMTLCSCGNQSIGFGNYTFKKVHIDTPHFSGCYTIVNWHDNERGIEVKTEEVGSLFLSEGTYILVEDKCPICDANK